MQLYLGWPARALGEHTCDPDRASKVSGPMVGVFYVWNASSPVPCDHIGERSGSVLNFDLVLSSSLNLRKSISCM